MKNLIQSAVTNTKAGQFLIQKCTESKIWANGVMIVGIAAMVGVCLI